MVNVSCHVLNVFSLTFLSVRRYAVHVLAIALCPCLSVCLSVTSRYAPDTARLRKTVYTHCASVHQPAKLVAALLRVARVTAGLAESNGPLKLRP